MKPATLEIKAFGPFGGSTRIDFEALSARSIFLVHGATGAGKTTLLDAICFALYGVTSGGDRSGREMRSHHASARARTEITFTFVVRGQYYRVWRAPEQERPRARGEGTITSKSQVRLEIRGDGTVLPDVAPTDAGLTAKQAQARFDLGEEEWTELANKAGDVEERITALFGLTADQFRQVVLLPQGRFRQFLLASSRERQAILQSLFGTERFSQIEAALKSEVEDLRRAMKLERERCGVLLEQAGIAEDKDPLVVRAQLLVQTKQAGVDLETAQATLAQARANAEAARAAEKLQAEQTAAQKALAVLAEEKPSIEKEEATLARAGRAAEATSAFAAHQLAQTNIATRDKEHRQARDAAQVAGAHRDEAHRALENERARAQEREVLQEKRRDLDRLIDRVAGFVAAKEQMTRARAAEVKALATVKQAEDAMASCVADHARAEDAVEEARVRAGELEPRRNGYYRILQARKAWLRREEVHLQEEGLLRRAADLIDEVAKAEASRLAANSARDAAEAAWMRGQAAELARVLTADQACPVCGSKDHPAPADGSIGTDDVSHRRFRSRRQDAEAAGQALTTLKTEAARVDAERKGLLNEALLLTEQLDERADIDRKRLEAEVDRAAAQIDEAEEAAAQVGALAASATTTAALLKTATEATVATRRAYEATRGQHEQAQAAAHQQSRGLPEAMLSADALKDAIDVLKAQQEAFDRARTAAEEQLVMTERAWAAADEAVRQGARLCTEATDQARRADDDFNQALARAHLNEEELRDAMLGPGDRERRAANVARFRAALASAQDRDERARAAAADPGARPSRASAEDAEREAHQHVATALKTEAELAARIEQLERALEGVSSAEGRALVLEEKYGVIGRIAEVALGDNPQRVTLQRFVLSTLLDEVLQTASDRLATMSRGRFLLRRTQGAMLSRRRALGLELSVVDQHTGTERAAATLSGGESFLAALALALGLADAVQARSGGRPLEAIFVDEGFGGLDPESLDLALSTLSQLTDSGRVVGIISHVAELRERIDARLHVKSGRRGSRVEATPP